MLRCDRPSRFSTDQNLRQSVVNKQSHVHTDTTTDGGRVSFVVMNHDYGSVLLIALMTVKYLALSVEYLLLHSQQFSCSILCNFYLVSLIRL